MVRAGGAHASQGPGGWHILTSMGNATGARLRLPAIELPREAIADVCRRHSIRRLALFGSALRTDFTPASDVDLLAWFEPERTPGFMGLIRIQDEFEKQIGHRVDLQTPLSLSRHIREEVLGEAFDVYAEAE